MKKIVFFLIAFVLTTGAKSQSVELVYNDSEVDGLIHLSWNLQNVSDWDSLRINYRTDDENSFSFLTTAYSPTTSFVDTAYCNKSVVYQAFLFYMGDTLAFDPLFPDNGSIDEIDPQPLPPILYSISYEDDSIRMEWEKTSDATALGYSVIRRFGSFHHIKEITNHETTSIKFLNDLVSPCSRQDSLLIITYDDCSESPNKTFDFLQALSVITGWDHQKCDRSIKVSFQEYLTSEAINQTITGHEIWAAEDNGEYELVETLLGGTTQYIHEDINNGSTYRYFIRTLLDIDGRAASSSSCPQEIPTTPIPLPDFFSIENITVTEDNHIDIVFSAEPEPELGGYRIYRSEAVQKILKLPERSILLPMKPGLSPTKQPIPAAQATPIMRKP
ncbi:MAG: hypothetical protein U5L09_09665 [Bacteroidales bacterium]|nr:hypothetical protein [Bacteroidales bacterium]